MWNRFGDIRPCGRCAVKSYTASRSRGFLAAPRLLQPPHTGLRDRSSVQAEEAGTVVWVLGVFNFCFIDPGLDVTHSH